MPFAVDSDFLKTLNDFTPAVSNQYNISIVDSSTSSEDRFRNRIASHIQFHATAVRFNGESINLERNKVSKYFQLTDQAYKRTDELTITWREDADWLVKKYHDNWLSLFYNKSKNAYISYSNKATAEKELKRTFKITLPVTNSTDNSTQNTIVFSGVLPKLSSGLDLHWDTNGSLVTPTLTYYVEDWYWKTE